MQRPKLTQVLVIDSSKDLGLQFQKIAKDTGLLVVDLENAWQRRDKSKNVVVLNVSKLRASLLRLEPEKELTIEKKQSWQQQQKKLPKFLRRYYKVLFKQ